MKKGDRRRKNMKTNRKQRPRRSAHKRKNPTGRLSGSFPNLQGIPAMPLREALNDAIGQTIIRALGIDWIGLMEKHSGEKSD
jgi:hypothetical protein